MKEWMMSEEQEKNFEVARRINRETLADPSSPYAGKVIGVWHGELVAVADTLDELDAALNTMGAPYEEAAVLDASVDYEQTYMIWRL